MKIAVTYAQLKTVGALAGAAVRYMDNGSMFRAVVALSGYGAVYFYDAASLPGTFALDFPLAVQVDAIDL